MARPITWRNIASPSFNSGAIGAASDAFSSAAQGFSRSGDQFQALDDKEAEMRTNRAIADAIAGKPLSNDPRVNQEQLLKVFGDKQITDSNLLTADLTRQKTGVEIKGLEIDNQFSPDVYKAQIDDHNASAAAAKARGDAAAYALSISKRDDAVRQQQIAALQGFSQGWNKEMADAVAREEATIPQVRADILKTRDNPSSPFYGKTDAEIDSWLQTEYKQQLYNDAQKNIGNANGYIDKFLANNPTITRDMLAENTDLGRMVRNQQDLDQERINKQIATEEANAAELRKLGLNLQGKNPTFEGLIYDGTGLRPATTEEASNNKLPTTGKALSNHLSTLMSKEITKEDEANAIKLADRVGGNRSAFDALIQNYGTGTRTDGWLTREPKVDWKGALAQADVLRKQMVDKGTEFLQTDSGTVFTGQALRDQLRTLDADQQFKDKEKTSTGSTKIPQNSADIAEGLLRVATDDSVPVADTVAVLKASLKDAQSRLDSLPADVKERNRGLINQLNNAYKYADGKEKPVPNYGGAFTGASGAFGKPLGFVLDPKDRAKEMQSFERIWQELMAAENQFKTKEDSKARTADILKQLQSEN